MVDGGETPRSFAWDGPFDLDGIFLTGCVLVTNGHWQAGTIRLGPRR